MSRFTLFALLIASGLAYPVASAAHQLGHSDQKVHTLANGSGQLLCRFTTGPLAGHVRALPPSATSKPGEPCVDDEGSAGEVILATVPPTAAAPDWWTKITNKYGTEEYQYKLPSHPPTAPASAAPPPPPPPPPATVQLPSGAGHGAKPPHTVDRSPAGVEPPVIAVSPASSSGTSSSAASGSKPPPGSDEVQQVHEWYEGLQKGSATYQVPTDMVMGETYSATAVIHPPTSPTPAAPDSHPLKISPYMRVVLNQTANPGTFDIKSEGNDCKFVSMDADTKWVFDVKPLVPGKDRVLDFAAYVVYGTGDATCKPENLKTIDVLSDTRRVTIAAITPRKAWQDIVVSFITDPTKWFKFILPGGLGFAALRWLYTWWKKRKSAKVPSPQPQHTP